jgi:hypothetical protein
MTKKPYWPPLAKKAMDERANVEWSKIIEQRFFESFEIKDGKIIAKHKIRGSKNDQ